MGGRKGKTELSTMGGRVVFNMAGLTSRAGTLESI
jgi:hypothetical protein